MLAPPMASGRWIKVCPLAFTKSPRYRVAFCEKLLPTVNKRTVLVLPGVGGWTRASPTGSSGTSINKVGKSVDRNIIYLLVIQAPAEPRKGPVEDGPST